MISLEIIGDNIVVDSATEQLGFIALFPKNRRPQNSRRYI
ncbi:hypothetical protein OROGR_029904 [Orobanche gracilis]